MSHIGCPNWNRECFALDVVPIVAIRRREFGTFADLEQQSVLRPRLIANGLKTNSIRRSCCASANAVHLQPTETQSRHSPRAVDQLVLLVLVNVADEAADGCTADRPD